MLNFYETKKESKGSNAVAIVLSILIIAIAAVACCWLITSDKNENDSELAQVQSADEKTETSSEENEPEINYLERENIPESFEVNVDSIAIKVMSKARVIVLTFAEDPTLNPAGFRDMFSSSKEEAEYRANVASLIEKGSKDVPTEDQMNASSFASYFDFGGKNQIVGYTVKGNVLTIKVKEEIYSDFQILGKENRWAPISLEFEIETSERELDEEELSEFLEDSSLEEATEEQ